MNHRVLLPVGGNGVILGGVQDCPQMRMYAKRYDRKGKLVVCRLWLKPQR